MADNSKDLLHLESVNPSFTAIESKLLVCGNSKLRMQNLKPEPPERIPPTSSVPKSQVMGKVKDFLGVISEANRGLDNVAKAKDYDLEVLTGNESEYIEMDLMLGVADLHTPEAVAAAESAIAGSRMVMPLASDESESESEEEDDSSDDCSESEADDNEGDNRSHLFDSKCLKRPSENIKSGKRAKIVELSMSSTSSSSCSCSSSYSSSPHPSPLPGNIPDWLSLPAEVTSLILHRLGAIEILESAQKVCLMWRSICKDRSMWRSIDMENLGNLFEMSYDLEKMCRHAVDRSCGGLIDINIEYFGTEELLHYVADRAPQLKSLRVACCYGITKDGLDKVAKKMPNLEELRTFFTEISNDDLESFGQCCPKLESLTYNARGSRMSNMVDSCEEQALVIGKSMSGLRHLSLFGSQMTNKGLQAILNGCPLLESLDLRQCFNVDLGGALGRACAQKIKNLKRPNDSTKGYKYITTLYGEYDDIPYEDDCFDWY